MTTVTWTVRHAYISFRKHQRQLGTVFSRSLDSMKEELGKCNHLMMLSDLDLTLRTSGRGPDLASV